MKQTIKIACLLSLVFFLFYCKKSSVTNPNVNFTATLNGSNEVPAKTTSGTGTAAGAFNNDTKMLRLTITYSGLSGPAVAAHIHKGAPGISGPVVFPFASTTSPITFTSPVLDSSEVADLNEGNFYVNIHTSANPGGEIRGQLVKQ